MKRVDMTRLNMIWLYDIKSRFGNWFSDKLGPNRMSIRQVILQATR